MISEEILANRWLCDVNEAETLPAFADTAEPVLWVQHSLNQPFPREVGLVFALPFAPDETQPHYVFIPFRDCIELDWQGARHILNHGVIQRLTATEDAALTTEIELIDLRLGGMVAARYIVWLRLLADHWRKKIVYPGREHDTDDNLVACYK